MCQLFYFCKFKLSNIFKLEWQKNRRNKRLRFVVARINAQRKQSSDSYRGSCCTKRNQTAGLSKQNFCRSCNVQSRGTVEGVRKNLKSFFNKHIAEEVCFLRKICFYGNRNQINRKCRFLVICKSEHEVRVCKNKLAHTTLNTQEFKLMASRIYNRNVLGKHKRTSVGCWNTDTRNCI